MPRELRLDRGKKPQISVNFTLLQFFDLWILEEKKVPP
jgi:hypothetical protein